MKTQEARKIADGALDSLIEALEQGKSEAMIEHLAAMSKFHRYSFGNVMLIVFQRPDAQLVAGYNTWLKLHRYVRKGEKGIVVLAPMRFKSAKNEPTENSEEAEGTSGNPEVQSRLRFRAVYVFDLSQTEGEELPQFAQVKGDPKEYLPKLRELVTAEGISLVYSDDTGGAEGFSQGGKITLRSNLPAASEFSALVHELTHEKLHHGERRHDTTKTIREVEAEAVAFVVSHAVGLDANTASSDYIQLYNGDKATLSASLDYIQKTSTQILQALGVGY